MITGYKIVMNNGNIYNYDTVQEPSEFLENVNHSRFIKVYKYTTKNDKAACLTVFLSTENISEIIQCEY